MKNRNEIPSSLIGHIYTQLLTTLFLALILSPSAMSAGIYKWVDKEGKVHYGSQRPADTSAERMNINVDTTPGMQSKKSTKQDDKNRVEETETTPTTEPEPPKISAKEKARTCKSARSRLQSILSHGRMREIDEKGEYVRLPEEERQKRIAATKKLIKKNCR